MCSFVVKSVCLSTKIYGSLLELEAYSLLFYFIFSIILTIIIVSYIVIKIFVVAKIFYKIYFL